MSPIWSDLRFAWRALKAKPVFTITAAASLALGIGANTAIFSVIDSALLRSLPFRDPDRLVYISDHQPWWESVSISPGEYLDYKRQTKTFQDIAALAQQNLTLTGVAEVQALRSRAVTTNFFDVLGAHAEVGRLFSPAIDKPRSGPRVAVISDALWRAQFAADRNIIGRDILLDNRPFEVVGVLVPHEEYPSDVQVWVSPRVEIPEFREGILNEMNIAQHYSRHWLDVIGRLKPGVSVAAARAELRTIAARIDATHNEPGHWAVLVPLQGALVNQIRPALAVLAVAVFVLLLIACANIAGLLLSRAASRTRELAVRVAVGASRWQITRLLLSESLLIAALGGACGIAIGYAALHLLRLYSPYELPAALAPQIDVPVLAFCFAASLGCALIVGIAPALNAARVDVNESLKESSKGSIGRTTHRFRRALVIGEITLSIVLLVGALLLVRSFSKLLDVNAGFSSSRTVTAEINLPEPQYSRPEQIVNFWKQLLARVQALPGAESSGLLSDIPLTGINSGGVFELEGRPVASKDKAPYSYHVQVTPNTIETLHIPLLAGRDFTDRDQANTLPVVMVNQTFVQRFFPHENPIGKRLRMAAEHAPWETIIGVVGNVKWEGLDAKPSLDVYRTYFQTGSEWANIVLRARPGSSIQLADVEAAAHAVDANVPISHFRSLDAYIDKWLGQRRFILGLLTTFSALAILLAAIGLYAVLAYSVEQRRQEFGIRVAIGANHSDVLWLVVNDCLTIAGVGVVLGIFAAFWSSAFLKSMLFGISDTDFFAYSISVLLIFSVAVAAALVPALRAARIDPITALRYE